MNQLAHWSGLGVQVEGGAGPARTPQILPQDQWPNWAKIIARRRKPGDAGIGDTVYRVIGPANSEAFQFWFYAIFRRSCGCAERRKAWNAAYPYPPA